MFPDGTIDLFKAYDCFLCGEICNSGDDFFYHLVDKHKANPFGSGATSSEDTIYFGPAHIINAALMAQMWGQKTIAEYIIKEHAKRFAMIKNVKV